MYILWYNNTSVWFFCIEKDRRNMISNGSNASCYHKEDQGQTYKDETKCNSVIENYMDNCVINLTTQIYTSFDRGKHFSYIFIWIVGFCKLISLKQSFLNFYILFLV